MGGSRLGYVRLRCLSMNRTLKFYTTVLQFGVKRKIELDEGSLSYLFLSSRGDGPEGAPGARLAVELRFECERFKQLKYSKISKVPVCTTSKVRLVFYVKSVRDVVLAVERSATGAWVFSLPQRHSRVVVAVVVDPNGLLIQLVEMTSDVLLKLPADSTAAALSNAHVLEASRDGGNGGSAGGGSGSSQNGGVTDKLSFSFALVRFGYVVIKSSNAMEQARYYETLFHPSTELEESGEDPHAIKMKDKAGTVDARASAAARRRRSAMDTAASRAGPATPRTGLFIVDKEDFPDMLSTYVWVGSGPRTLCTTLCFMHKIERQSANITRQHDTLPNSKKGKRRGDPKRGAAAGAAAGAAGAPVASAQGGSSNNNGQDENKEEKNGDAAAEDATQEDAVFDVTQFMLNKQNVQEADPFLGIGIVVEDDIKATMRRLQRNVRYPVTFSSELRHMPAVGDVCGFVDLNQVQVRLLDANSPETSAKAEEMEKGKHKATAAEKRKVFGNSKRAGPAANVTKTNRREIPGNERDTDPTVSLSRYRELEEKRKAHLGNRVGNRVGNDTPQALDVDSTSHVPGKVFPGRMERLKEAEDDPPLF